MKIIRAFTFVCLLNAALVADEPHRTAERVYELWEGEPAPNRGNDWEKIQARGMPYDEDWEQWSYPLGNGYVGANLFGRTDRERIQITEKTLHNKSVYGRGGLTNFAELYLDFSHTEVRNYRRSLNLNEAIARVSYEHDGVNFEREYFTSYPDYILVVRLTADKPGALSFRVRPEIPHLDKEDKRTGTITAEGDLLTLKGTVEFFNCHYEGQIKVILEGGTLLANQKEGEIAVSNADSVTLIVATGTNYRLSPRIFTAPPAEKLDAALFPHDEVSARIKEAHAFGYDTLKQRHLRDYQNLFGRVSVNLNSTPSPKSTHTLLEDYKQGQTDTWLEELMFQYGRYLLIASSREKTLPANLQGTWSQYYWSPWSGGYWHNINVQMNYWGALSGNLAETFEAYIKFFNAYLPEAKRLGDSYVRTHSPERLGPSGENGWIIGTGSNAYYVSGPGGHSGPGTGGFTSKLLMDYSLFTQDKVFTETVAWPVMESLSQFYAKALVEKGDLLLVTPSASPEQRAKPAQILNMPGTLTDAGYYVTVGCTFDQGFVWENYNDTLILAELLAKSSPIIDTIRSQIDKLDPIQVGASGQIKEYREELNYSDIGDPKHRHISHLCPLYPGTLINSERPDWMQAASKTLDLRGDKTTGWAQAHRMNTRARLKEGQNAHAVYSAFIKQRVAPNLWAMHPPFQIDGNLGTMAGVVEMLLQSHEGYIEVLPALPQAWATGSFKGLVARGNFVISAEWKNGRISSMSVHARSGGVCRIKIAGTEIEKVIDAQGQSIDASKNEGGVLSFSTSAGGFYRIIGL